MYSLLCPQCICIWFGTDLEQCVFFIIWNSWMNLVVARLQALNSGSLYYQSGPAVIGSIISVAVTLPLVLYMSVCLFIWCTYCVMAKLINGHSRKHPYNPHRGNWKLTPPPTPFGCPNSFTIIRNNFVSPPPLDGKNFFCEGSVGLFWNDPINEFKTFTLEILKQQITIILIIN